MSIKVAFAGAGGIAEHHLKALATVGDVEIVGITSRRQDAATALTGKFGGAAFSDINEMLDKTRPDAVFICVTPKVHGPYERAVLERKIPFFVEKPLSIDWETAAALAADVERTKVVTAVGYQWRYHASVDKARELLAGKQIGMALGHWLTRTPAPAWWSRAEESGGQMVEQLTHMFDLSRMFLGEAESVFALTTRVPRASHSTCDVDEASIATIRFKSGTIASLSSTCILAASHKVGLNLYAENLAVEIGAAALTLDAGAGRVEEKFDRDATVAQDRAFIEAVKTGDGSKVRSSYTDALATHRLVTLARESARTGQAVPVGR